jgi:hypothetical protein
MQPTFWNKPGQPAPFHDKAFRRSALPACHERWRRLSLGARQKFIKAFPLRVGLNFTPPPAPESAFTPAEGDELIAAGFLRREHQGHKSVLVEDAEAGDFGTYVRSLDTFHPLLSQDPGAPHRYIQHAFATYTLNDVLRKILDRHGFKDLGYTDVTRLLPHRRQWPGWVAEFLASPVLQEILDAVETAGGRVRWVDLPALLPGHAPAEVRAGLEQLVTHLALFEDVDPATADILIGFLPQTLADLRNHRNPRPRPELTPRTPAGEPTPDPGYLLGDLRALLLELTVSPARVKQDGTMYRNDGERLEAALDSLHDPLDDFVDLSISARIEHALHTGRTLGFLDVLADEKNGAVRLLPAGERWLRLDAGAQFVELAELLRGQRFAFGYPGHDAGDYLFLGFPIQVAVKGAAPSRPRSSQKGPAADDREPLREALYGALRELPVGTYCRLVDLMEHAVYGEHNPLLLGRLPDQVSVRYRGQTVLALEQELVDLGEGLLRVLVRDRLIPLGCVQAALDEEEDILIARRPQLDLYFGKPPGVPPAPATPTRIVVQPDFTVVVMGSNPAQAADLVPFCERVRGSAGSSSLTLRLTRDLVLKAINEGLPGEEIVTRLERSASMPLPGNVAHELREWCGWVRRVTVAPASLVRCPDRATADRVQSALGRKAERLNDTTVAFTAGALTGAEKQKLQKQGVFLEVEEPPTKKKKKRK